MAGVYAFFVLLILWLYCEAATASLCDTVSWSAVSPPQPLHQAIKTNNLLQCMHVCKYIPKCNSVTYDVSRRDCALHTEPEQQEPQRKIFDSICKLGTAVHGPCDGNPCLNNAQCIPIGTTYICLDILQCPVTASPEKGNMTYHGNTVLSRRQLVCDVGYEVTGPAEGTCTTDGTWDNAGVTCQEITCPVTASPEKGNMTYHGNTVLSRRQLVCDVGYVVTGPAEGTCTTEGTWDNAGVTCQEIDCGIPPAMTGATVDYTATRYGSAATYTCEALMSFPGGNKTKTTSCSQSGIWTLIQKQCETDVVLIDGWALVFRISAGINVFSYDVWMNSSVYHDHPLDRKDVMPGCRSLNSSLPCDLHFRSKALNEWTSLNIIQVKILLIAEAEVKAVIVFDGKNSNKESWFNSNRVISSSWSDLSSSTIFRINGWQTRRFYINYFLGRCAEDSGWLVVLDSEPRCSSYMFPNGPTIMYSPISGKSLIASEYRKADAMAILVKLGPD